MYKLFNNLDGKNNQSQRRNSLILYLAILLTGSCGLAYEYTVSKVASDLLGNSTRQWAMIIGVMMFFMGLGANYQKNLSWGSLFAWFALLEMLLSLLGGLSPLLLLRAYAYWQSYYVLWQYLLIAAIGFLIGLEIPIITRINESFTPELKVNIGRTLQMDYVGALGGAVLWSYWLIPYLPLSRASVILGFANMAVTWLFMAYFYSQLRWRKLLLSLGIAVSVILLWAFFQGPQWSLQMEQGLYRDPIVFSKTTSYQHLVLTQSARPRPTYLESYRSTDESGIESRKSSAATVEPEYRLYINGHLQFSSRDEFIYHENLVHPAFALFRQRTGHDPARVLILGGGDGLALREVLKYQTVQEAILCDLDPEMLRLAADDPTMRRLNQDALHGKNVIALFAPAGTARGESQHYRSPAYLNAGKGQLALTPVEESKIEGGTWADESLSESRVVIKDMDAMRYIEKAEGFFDVIIADFPDPNSETLSKLYSLPFYHSVGRKLDLGGVFVQQSTSPAYAWKAFWAIGRTMMAAGLEALPYKDFVPSFGEWGWWLAVKPEWTGPTLQQQYQASRLSRQIPLRYFSDEIMQANHVFAPALQAMYRDSLTLLLPDPKPSGDSTIDSESGIDIPKNGLETNWESDLGKFYADWVTTYTQSKVYQYYIESNW